MGELKRYAITYTIDYDWNTVDTFIITTDKNPLDMSKEELKELFYGYIGNKEEVAKVAPYHDQWFIRNLEDTDVYWVSKKGE